MRSLLRCSPLPGRLRPGGRVYVDDLAIPGVVEHEGNARLCRITGLEHRRALHLLRVEVGAHPAGDRRRALLRRLAQNALELGEVARVLALQLLQRAGPIEIDASG